MKKTLNSLLVLIAILANNTQANNKLSTQQYIDSTKHYWYLDIDKSNQYADSALSTVDTTDYLSHAKCIKNKGVVYYFKQNFDTALQYYQKALIKFTQAKDSIGLAIIYQNTGAIYDEQSKYEQALINYSKGYEIAIAINDTKRIFNIVVNWCNIYHHQGDFDKALELMKKVLPIAQPDNWVFFKSLGVSYLKVGNSKAAEKYLIKAQTICINTNNESGLAIVNTNMGELYLETHQYKKATIYFKKSLPIFKKLNYSYGLTYIFNGLGRAAMETGNYEVADNYFNKGLSLAEKDNMLTEMEILYESVYENNLLKRDIANAVKYKKLKKQMQDSIYTEKYLNKMTDMEAKYKSLEKEQQIQKLSAEKAQQQLQLQNERKNRLLLTTGVLFLLLLSAGGFMLYRAKQRQKRTELSRNKADMENKLLRSQMNPHFMFNSLNSVQNYILKNDKMEACNYLASFSDLIRDILQNSRLSFIPLDEELETLNKYLKLEQLRFKDKLEYSVSTNLSIDASEINIPPMILQPYIENAIIHGIAPKEGLGHIKIHIENSNYKHIKCTIHDNGIGRKAAAKIKKPSRAKSLGMMVTGERLQHLQAECGIELKTTIRDLYEGDIATGTQVEVILPIENLN